MSEANAIEAVVGWMDAMRRGDLTAAAQWFDSQVTWRGISPDAVCRDREDVLEMLGDGLIPCPEDPDAYELEPGLRGAEAVELVSAGTGTVEGARAQRDRRRPRRRTNLQRLPGPRRANRRGRRLRGARRGPRRRRGPGAGVALISNREAEKRP
jgi:hypothetical protein